MTLIGILIALGLERVLGQFPGWGRPVLFLAYVHGALRLSHSASLWRYWTTPLILIVPPVVLVYWVGGRIGNPFVDLAWSAAILVLCLGPRDLAEDVHALLEARNRGDESAVVSLSRTLQRGPQPDASNRSLLGALFIQSHERLFGVLLWFFLLGAPGAVAYRLASRLPRIMLETAADTPAQRTADLLHNALAWLPARITAMIFGLAGSLDDAIREWRRLASGPRHEWRSHTWAILAEVSAASLRMEEEDGASVVPATLDACLAEVLRMQTRALLILLAFFAFFATGSML